MPFVFNRFPASSEQRQCSNNVSPFKAGACNTSRLPNRPWGAASHKKAKKLDIPETELPDGSGDYGPPGVPRGPPGARSPRWGPQLEATLAFPPF